MAKLAFLAQKAHFVWPSKMKSTSTTMMPLVYKHHIATKEGRGQLILLQ
jgi:hypothetical protein